jgi:SPP1 gp7 family putative phage head morphogenesis protein
MREHILNALKESVKAYPELRGYLSDNANVLLKVLNYKIGEAPDDEVRLKDERKLTRGMTKYLEGLKQRVLTYIRTHDLKGIQPSFWDKEEQKLWAELGDDFVGIILHGVDGGINLLQGAGSGSPVDEDKINMSLVKYGRQYRDKWLHYIEETSRKYVDEQINNWMLSGDPLSVLINTMNKDQGGMFSKMRASRIAVTEVTRLHAMGNQLAWEEAGDVKEWRWNSANDDLVCPICIDGVKGNPYPIDTLSEKLPAHVNCRCWSTPIVTLQTEEEIMQELIEAGLGVEEGISLAHEVVGRTKWDDLPIYKVQDTTNFLSEFEIGVISKDGREILATIENALHGELVRGVHPEASVDDYIRFIVTKDKALQFIVDYAGIVVDDERSYIRALNNIYDAMERLASRGLDPNTNVVIRTRKWEDEDINTTLKSKMGIIKFINRNLTNDRNQD